MSRREDARPPCGGRRPLRGDPAAQTSRRSLSPRAACLPRTRARARGAQSTALAQAPAFGGRGARAGGRTGQAPASQRVQLRTTTGRRSEPALKRSVFCKRTQITRGSLLVEFTGAHFSKSVIFSTTLRSRPKMTRSNVEQDVNVELKRRGASGLRHTFLETYLTSAHLGDQTIGRR